MQSNLSSLVIFNYFEKNKNTKILSYDIVLINFFILNEILFNFL